MSRPTACACRSVSFLPSISVHSKKIRRLSVTQKWRQASISSSSGHLRAAGTSAARSSWFAAWSETARWMGLASSAMRRIPGTTPTVLSVIRSAASDRPLGSRRMSVAFITAS